MSTTTFSKAENTVEIADATLLKIATEHMPKLVAYMETELLPFEIVSSANESPSKAVIEHLSVHKLNVLKMLADGKGYEEIAKEMNLSINTIRFRIKQIYKALNVDNKVDAARLYLAYQSSKL